MTRVSTKQSPSPNIGFARQAGSCRAEEANELVMKVIDSFISEQGQPLLCQLFATLVEPRMSRCWGLADESFAEILITGSFSALGLRPDI